MTSPAPAPTTEPAPIVAKPLRHPVRWTITVILALLTVLFLYGAATNPAYRWDLYFQYLLDTRIAAAAGYTIILTVGAMILGVLLGAALAVMRMSPNPVLRGIGWLYLWIFRGTPVYVQLVFWGLLGAIYDTLDIGIPFVVQFWHIDLSSLLSNMLLLSIIGLGLNEAAYMAEIVRAGISSVPEGQVEASKALGMTWTQTMRRTVLPQAMRIIIPPTGNELISMLKTTSLVVAVPFSLELYGRATDIATQLFQPIPMLLVAATWYLVITSILMVIQSRIEKRFSRGATRQLTGRQLAALADAEGAVPTNVTIPHTSTEER